MALNLKQPPVTVTGRILRETAAALLLEVEGTGIWFPLSTVHEIHHSDSDPYSSRVVVDQWIAQRKGLC